jgi:ankyrin repeat protein
MNFDEASNAIKKGDVLRLRNYLEAGLDPNLSTQYGWTLLMCAAMEGNTAAGRELIQRGAQLDARNKHSATALSLAAHTGHPRFVALLLDAGASLDGHPFGKSFEDFLEWASNYGTGSREAMAKTKAVIESARAIQHRSENGDEPSA